MVLALHSRSYLCSPLFAVVPGIEKLRDKKFLSDYRNVICVGVDCLIVSVSEVVLIDSEKSKY